MQAFPVGSANMALGGSGPLNSRIDLDKFHGRGEEAFDTFAATRKADTAVVDPTARIEPVHGEESHGLGTSTFLEGAPASRSALERRDSEDQQMAMGGGLQRKKSLAQRLRGMSNTRRERPNGLRSPDARYGPVSANLEYSPPGGRPAISAGGPTRAKYTRENEINPFDNDYEDAYEKKGTQIKIAEQERPTAGRPRAPSSPKGFGLTRSMTADSAAIRPTTSGNDEKPASSGGGFLNRMRSLKGGRRARPERRDS